MRQLSTFYFAIVHAFKENRRSKTCERRDPVNEPMIRIQTSFKLVHFYVQLDGVMISFIVAAQINVAFVRSRRFVEALYRAAFFFSQHNHILLQTY